MRRRLFRDLFKLVSECFPRGSITKTDFLLYLLGYYSSSYSRTIPYDTFSNLELSEYIKGDKSLPSILGNWYPKILEANQNLCLEDLIIATLSRSSSKETTIRKRLEELKQKSTEIINLYNKHSLPLPHNINAEQLLLNLFTKCITDEKEFLFGSYKNQRIKPSTIKFTLGRNDDAENLKSDLEQYHKIVISGEYGIGKSHFIKYCLAIWQPKDYCYINYIKDLDSTIDKIKFYHDYGNKYLNTSKNDLTDKVFSSSLLIIDHMYYSSNFEEELEQLASYAINIIVITVGTVSTNSFHNFQLSPLPDNILWDIFQMTFPILSCDEFWKEELLCLIQKNTLMISLIAHQCKKLSKISPDLTPLEILKQVLSQLKILDNRMNFDFKEKYFKHRYTDKTLDLFGHIKAVYKNFIEYSEEDLQNQMRYLCCFGWTILPLKFLSEVFPNYNEEHLKQLSDWGLLSLTDESVQLSPLIVHATVATTNPSPTDYSDLIPRMIDFLNGFDKKLDVPYLSDILFVFIQTLYEKVSSKNNPKQAKTSKEFEKWQDLIYLVYHYYNECGDFSSADGIASTIHYPKLINTHSPSDIIFLHLGNDMQLQSALDTMYTRINNACAKNYAPTTDTTYFFINVLNSIIRFYCINLLAFNRTINKNYQYRLICLMEKILSYIMHPKHDTKVSIDNDKLYYYQLCYQIMVNPVLSFNSIDLSLIQKLDNLNYRIRGMAFLIFLESYCIISGYIDCDPSSVLKVFKEKISLLHRQILKCQLIPFETFRLCIYSYISVAALQYGIYSNKETIHQPISPIFDINQISSLSNHTIISKEEVQSIIDQFNKYLI